MLAVYNDGHYYEGSQRKFKSTVTGVDWNFLLARSPISNVANLLA